MPNLAAIVSNEMNPLAKTETAFSPFAESRLVRLGPRRGGNER
ncbi:hypothetical protein RRSWK_02774 [Rhodopirellula sp. SWK7]|nr:hypothetical protein RRSWK_02774 [Rhodopirellula sp. SWK7]